MNMNNELAASVGLVLGALLGCSLWWNTWVQPRDEFLYSVMDCMSEIDDNSQAGYEFCATKIRAELK